MRKLPYIPDKDLYAAVMFACKMIRKNGYFNKACRIAANFYEVDEDEVKQYVRIAQGNGQRIANKRKGKIKYHWYAVLSVPDSESNPDYNVPWTADYTRDDYLSHCRWRVVRALNQNNAKRNVMGLPKNPDLAIEDGGYRWNRVLYIKEFETQKEANAYVGSIGKKELEGIIDEYYDDRIGVSGDY